MTIQEAKNDIQDVADGMIIIHDQLGSYRKTGINMTAEEVVQLCWCLEQLYTRACRLSRFIEQQNTTKKVNLTSMIDMTNIVVLQPRSTPPRNGAA